MLKLTIFSSWVTDLSTQLQSHLPKQNIFCNIMTELCYCSLLLQFNKFLSTLDLTALSLRSTLAERFGFLCGKPQQDDWSQRVTAIMFLLGSFSAGSVPWIIHWIDSEMVVAVQRAEKAGVGANDCQWKTRQTAAFI